MHHVYSSLKKNQNITKKNTPSLLRGRQVKIYRRIIAENTYILSLPNIYVQLRCFGLRMVINFKIYRAFQ